MTNATRYDDLESRFRYRRENCGIVDSKDDHPPFNLQSQKRNGFIAGIIVLYLLVFSSDGDLWCRIRETFDELGELRNCSVAPMGNLQILFLMETVRGLISSLANISQR